MYSLEKKHVTYCFQVALDIADIPTTRAARVSTRLVDHILDQVLAVEYTLFDDLKADNVSALLKDVG